MNYDEKIIEELNMCFQELKDKGFKVRIKQTTTNRVDFTNGQIINILEEIVFIIPKVPCFYIEIDKFYDDYREFNIRDIIEDLLFVEDYIKDIYNLNIIKLYDDDYYYENIKNLSKDKDINIFGVHFIKD